MRRPRPSKRLKQSIWNDASRARELSFLAWRTEVDGDTEAALEVYRESSQHVLDPMALSNAANLLARGTAFKRADAYWQTALVACGEVAPRRRLGNFLGRLAWQQWLRGAPRDTIALATHAFEHHATPGLAHTLGLAYRAVDDLARAKRAVLAGLRLDSRHAECRALAAELGCEPT